MHKIFKFILSSVLVFVFALAQAVTAKNPEVLLHTNQGDIKLELYADKAPKAVENFTTLVEKGYYNNLTFHRVIKGFMIQGGDPTGTGRGGESKWGKPFNDEIVPSLKFDQAGVLAMANAGPNTNGSQFFITVAPQSYLNGGYTIFGKVIGGMDVVNNIDSVATDSNDRPLETQKIIKAEVVNPTNASSIKSSSKH